MPIIDSRSESKFDALVRTNKADALMSFIMATATVKDQTNRKEKVAEHLKSAYKLFREDIKGSESGAGSYGNGTRDINEQFESHYTMGYEMGIWCDSDYHLNALAKEVSQYKITVSEYIGVVFFNLFSYYKKNNKPTYHHFLFEILEKSANGLNSSGEISKEMIAETLPIEKNVEQANIIYNYLIASDLFEQVEKNTMRLSDKWKNKGEELKLLCNLEYNDLESSEANKKFQNKKFYAQYVTKRPNMNDNGDIKSEKSVVDFDTADRLSVGKNVLLYGVPGSGKSWTIQNEYCNDDNLMERLVFHPDYTYSDFVGQILPNVSEDGMVSYNFTPGPFTTLMKKAYTNPDKEYFLVIEEINRGNAPAIFGEIFQLLDRKTEVKEKNDDGYTILTSEYGISNGDIAKVVYGDSERKVRIPSNMSIIGTMNTSDQNVFTLDTAFQRRWSMRLIENKFKDDDFELANQRILDTSVTWQMFCESINKIIVDKNSRITSSEDKRLGTHFVYKNDLIFDSRVDDSADEKEKMQARLNNRKFPEKVIKYLWDDAFKFSREEIFDVSRYNSLELIIEKFINSKANKRYGIFKENIYNLLVPNGDEGIDE